MKRTKLCARVLPDYTRAEEIMNMVTHIVGGALGVLVLVLCILKAGGIRETLGAVIFGTTMICTYTMSSIYHGLLPSTGKKVLQVLDHCAIYFLIAGTYTPILLGAFIPSYPAIGWGLLIFQWTLCFLAATLTAIDLEAYNLFSMFCYVGMGWAIALFIPQCVSVLSTRGFGLLLAGGISYTIGAVLYGIGGKLRWMHSVFHIFVVIGSLLQALSILLYAL